MIVAGRIRGEPVTKIAEKIGTTRTYVYNVLEKFPKDRSFVEGGDSFSEEDQIFIASWYLSVSPPNARLGTPEWKIESARTVSEIAGRMNSSEAEVWNVLYKMRGLHSCVRHSPCYPQIEAWRKKNAVSLKSLAVDCGVDAVKLRNIFAGYEPMPLSVATGISMRSGLSLKDIYGTLLLDLEHRQSQGAAAGLDV